MRHNTQKKSTKQQPVIGMQSKFKEKKNTIIYENISIFMMSIKRKEESENNHDGVN